VRPVSHILRLIQQRTLHLQRIVATSPAPADQTPTEDKATIPDLAKRLEELEAYIASSAAQQSPPPDPSADEVRKSMQPEIEALNRAVRRYEKRSALFALQTDQRFGRIEAQAGDALALAAAAVQRREAARSGYALVLLEWFCACVVVPVQVGVAVLGLPGRAVSGGLEALKGLVGWKVAKSRTRGKGKGVASRPAVRRRPKEEWVAGSRDMY
jgi:hypothetical protein